MNEYPKMVEGIGKDINGEDVAVRVAVDDAHQESTVKDKTAEYVCVKSAQGDTWRWVGPWPTTKPVKEEPDPDTVSEMLGFKKSKKKK